MAVADADVGSGHVAARPSIDIGVQELKKIDDGDVEYPGVRWVLANYILMNLKDGQAMPRCQDLPEKAFGSVRNATRVFAVTHPWLGRWQPDPDGIQVETLRAKLGKMKKQLMVDKDDVVFVDYMCLPQVSSSGVDDRTKAEMQRFKTALSGDLMGRIYLTSRVIIIDEVPKEAESSVPYPDRGWCYFECMVASLNTFPRDLQWVDQRVKDEIARFRNMAADFRESGELGPLLEAFDAELPAKLFSNASDAELVRGFFISLARSQRLISAAARGDSAGALQALDEGADPYSRNGQGRTALHVAMLNQRVAVVAALLRRVDASVASMKTMENESGFDLAKQAGSRECQVLIRYKLGEAFPELLIRAIEGDTHAVRRLLPDADEEESSVAAVAAGAPSDSKPKATTSAVPVRSGDGPASPVSSAKSGAKSFAATRAVPAKALASKTGTSAPGRPGTGTSGRALGKAVPPARGSAMRSAGCLVLERGPSPTHAASMSEAPATPAQSPDSPLAAAGKPSTQAARGTQDTVAVDCADDEGFTPLYYAVSLQHLQIVQALVAARADANVRSKEGDSPMECAKRLNVAPVLSALQGGAG